MTSKIVSKEPIVDVLLAEEQVRQEIRSKGAIKATPAIRGNTPARKKNISPYWGVRKEGFYHGPYGQPVDILRRRK